MSIIYNKPYSDGPYAVTDFLAGGHMFYIIYEFVLTILNHHEIKLEPRVIENRWMDDFDHIRKMKSHHVDYITNEKGHMEFSIEGENYIGQSTNDDVLVFSRHGKKGLTSVCYELKTVCSEDLSYTWRHHYGRKFIL